MEYNMRKVKLLIAFTLLLMLTGCTDAVSLQPLYTDEDLSFDPALLGTWVDSDHGFWEFTEESETEYRLVITRTVSEHGQVTKDEYEVHLVNVEGAVFLDFLPVKLESPDGVSDPFNFVPAHIIVRVMQVEPTLIFKDLASWDKKGWLDTYLEDNPTAITHEKGANGDILLTAPPKELQKFLLAHLEDVFDDEMELKRREQETTPAGE
jgi:hypothetical protein